MESTGSGAGAGAAEMEVMSEMNVRRGVVDNMVNEAIVVL